MVSDPELSTSFMFRVLGNQVFETHHYTLRISVIFSGIGSAGEGRLVVDTFALPTSLCCRNLRGPQLLLKACRDREAAVGQFQMVQLLRFCTGDLWQHRSVMQKEGCLSKSWSF